MLIAAAVALSRLFTTGDPPPIGLYIIVWAAAQAAAGLTIFVGYGQAIRTTARFQHFQAFIQLTSATHDADELIAAIGQTVNSMHGLSLVGYQLRDGTETFGAMHLASGVSLSDAHSNALAELSREAANAALESRAAVVRKGEELDVTQIEALHALNAGAIVFLPLIQDDVVQGMVCLAGADNLRINQSHRRFMVTLGEQAAKAISTGEVGEQVQFEISSYQGISAAITQELDIENLLSALVEWVSRHFQLDGASVTVIDLETSTVSATVGQGRLERSNGESPGSTVEDSLVENYVLEKGEPVRVNGIEMAPQEEGVNIEEAKRLGISGVIGVPLKSQQGVFGVITGVRVSTERPFSEDDERRLTSLANQAAISLENARLYALEKQRAVELDKLAQMKSGLMYSVSHELRTSLASLKAAAEILTEEEGIDPGGEYYYRLLQSISRNVARQEVLVANLVDMESLENSALTLNLERVDVPALVAESTSIVAPLINQRGQTLTISVPPDLPPILADRQRLSQVLVNLLTNARKYAPEDTEIALVAEINGRNMQFTVSDAGRGIPQEERERIFEPFYRVQSSADMGVPGSGMGLAIVKSLVELHRGKIWVEDSPSNGASFVVSLPIEGVNENSGH